MPPLVAITVIVYDPAGVPGFPGEEELLELLVDAPPPQPNEQSSPNIAHSRSAFLRLAKGSKRSPKPVKARRGSACKEPGLASVATAAVVAMVRVEFAGCEPGVTDAGAKEHVANAGKPEQANVTGDVNGAGDGVTVNAIGALVPAVILV